MIGPSLYNLLLFRGFHGRRSHWKVAEAEYDKPQGAFGRMQLVIQLGDFLQKKPIGGSSVSLIDDLVEPERSGILQIMWIIIRLSSMVDFPGGSMEAWWTWPVFVAHIMV